LFEASARKRNPLATAATLAAMTACNVYRARKAEREHPANGRFIAVDGNQTSLHQRGEGPQSFCSTAT
jgi:hypothetical protein